MIPMVNLNNVVDKELELEHQSLRRTRRWLANANQNVYESWYPTKANQVSGFGNNLDKVSRGAANKPRGRVRNSILTHLSNLLNTRRQPVRVKVRN